MSGLSDYVAGVQEDVELAGDWRHGDVPVVVQVVAVADLCLEVGQCVDALVDEAKYAVAVHPLELPDGRFVVSRQPLQGDRNAIFLYQRDASEDEVPDAGGELGGECRVGLGMTHDGSFLRCDRHLTW